MRKSSLLVVGVLALLSFGLLASKAEAKPEFAVKEKATCPTCHDMTQFPKRNATGECYKQKGFKDLAACTKGTKKDPSLK